MSLNNLPQNIAIRTIYISTRLIKMNISIDMGTIMNTNLNVAYCLLPINITYCYWDGGERLNPYRVITDPYTSANSTKKCQVPYVCMHRKAINKSVFTTFKYIYIYR